MSRLIFPHVRYATLENESLCIRQATIVVTGDRITEITSQPIEPDAADEVVDCTHKVLLPGLINAHGHAPMTLLRGLKDDAPLNVWLEQHMWPAEAKYTDGAVRAGALLAMVEMIKTGTTTFLDMYDRMEVVAETTAMVGLRACLSRGIIGLCSEAEQKEKIKQADSFFKQWHGKAEGKITTMVAPHALYTCPPALVQSLIELAHEHGVPMHIHLSETQWEVAQHVATYGMRPPEHLQRLGGYEVPLVVAHAVHVNEDEIAAFAAQGVAVVHNPRSNLKLASGVAPIPAMLQAGVCVALGTDSAASNNNLDLFQEMRTAALIHKGVTFDPTVIPARTAWEMATVGGARALHIKDVGSIAVGMKADLIALDTDVPHVQPVVELASHLVYAASGSDVTDVWVDGKPLLRNRMCTTIDEEAVKFEANRAYQRLMGQ